MCGWDDSDRPPVNCAEGWNKWTEVCACTENLCNTFAFLRANMDRQNDELLTDDRGRNQKFEGGVRNTKSWYHSNNQVVLLIMIPLGVGGFLVCLIFLNFHCKMS
uniref:Uncharacterized protein n=1 Tax=Panagrolaimus sp. ES5 TaxID=591445 RepID=A0AC34GSY4_9BILA